jgi:hypothetical protein
MPERHLPTCPACSKRPLRSASERVRELCDRCAKDTGLWQKVPPLRPARPCTRCNHTRFVRAQLRERAATGGDHSAAYMAPLAISFATEQAGVFALRQRARPHEPIGIIVAYVCQRCGFTELYTLGANQIPIGPQYGTEMIEVGPDGAAGPFR